MLHIRPILPPRQPRDTDFALGKAWVGQQIVKLIKLKLGKLQKEVI